MTLMEIYITGTGQRLMVHSKAACTGNFCVIHRPSVHAMSAFPTNWRRDTAMMERVCPHGIGHPDPDDLAFRRTTYMGGRRPEHVDALSVHGCDGCCRK